MTTQLTSTTGTVKGKSEVKAFIRMANQMFSSVTIVDSLMLVDGYIQYTLLNDNSIKIFI